MTVDLFECDLHNRLFLTRNEGLDRWMVNVKWERNKMGKVNLFRFCCVPCACVYLHPASPAVAVG
jgi:hypothetical protein